MPRKSEIQAEEAVVGSPLRRSTRISVTHASSPAPITARRNSQTETTETKPLKTRRASLSQENGPKDEKVESKPAPRGRRASASKEEPEQKPEPAKTRSRRSSTASDHAPEPEQKKPITRRRISASVEDQPEETSKPIRGRRGSSAEKTIEEDTTKKPVRQRRGSVKEEETKEEPVKRSTRGRRVSVDKVEEPELEIKEKKPRGRRASTEIIEEEEAEGKLARLPAKTRRRLSVTEGATNLELIVEQDSEEKGRSSISPELNRAVVVLTPIKMNRRAEIKANLDLSVIHEDNSNDNKPEELSVTPRKSPLNNIRNSPVRKSPRLGKGVNGVQKSSPTVENTVESVEATDTNKSAQQDEDDVFEETVGKTRANQKAPSPRKNRLAFEPEKAEEVPCLESSSQKPEETITKEAPNISIGSDGSFRFHLNMSLPSSNSQNDAEDVADLNTSKNSNSSDKENQAVTSPSVPDVKRGILEDMQNLSDMKANDLLDKLKLEENVVVVARVSNVFRPRMRENSFLEPMEVDEFPLTPQKPSAGSKIDKMSPMVSTPLINEVFTKPEPNQIGNKTIVDDTVDESFKLCLSTSQASQDGEGEADKSEVANSTDDSELMAGIDQKRGHENCLESGSNESTRHLQDLEELKQTETPEKIEDEKEEGLIIASETEMKEEGSAQEQTELNVKESTDGNIVYETEMADNSALEQSELNIKENEDTNVKKNKDEFLELEVKDDIDQVEDSTRKCEGLRGTAVLETEEEVVKDFSEDQKTELERSEETTLTESLPVQQIAESKTRSKSKSPRQELNTNKLAPKKELLRRSNSPRQGERNLEPKDQEELSKTTDENDAEEKQEVRKSKRLLPQTPTSDESPLHTEEIAVNKFINPSSIDSAVTKNPEIMETENSKVIPAHSPAREIVETAMEKLEDPKDSVKEDATEYSFELPSDDELELTHDIEAEEDNICGTENKSTEGVLKRKSPDPENLQSKKIKLTPGEADQNMTEVDEHTGTPQLGQSEVIVHSGVEGEDAPAQIMDTVKSGELLTPPQDGELDVSLQNKELEEDVAEIGLAIEEEKDKVEMDPVNEEVNVTRLDSKEPEGDYKEMESDFKDEVQSYRVVEEEASGNLKISILETSMGTVTNSVDVHTDKDSEKGNVLVPSEPLEVPPNGSLIEKSTVDDICRSPSISKKTAQENGKRDKTMEAPINEAKEATESDEEPEKKKQNWQSPVKSGKKDKTERKKQAQSKSKKEDMESKYSNDEKETEDNISKEVIVKKKSSRLEGLEEFASSKLDEFLSKKLLERDDTDDSYECTSDEEDNETERNEFISSMAEEGEEDTPSEGSNDIVEAGESLHSTDSEVESDDDYDENDSFICDEEYGELLSGEEYDLEDDTKSKQKKSRIIRLDGFEEDVIKIEKKEKPVKKNKKSRIIVVSDSSESEEETVQVPDGENETAEECSEQEQVAVDSATDGSDVTKVQTPRRRSIITIHENISVAEIQDTALSERITQLVDTFCTTIQKGEISMNLSLEHAIKCNNAESQDAAQDRNDTKSIKTPRKSIQKSPASNKSSEADDVFVKRVKKTRLLNESSDETAQDSKKKRQSTAGSNDAGDDTDDAEQTKKKYRGKRKKRGKQQTYDVASDGSEKCLPEKMADRLSITLNNIDDLGETKKRTSKKRRLSKSLDDLSNLAKRKKTARNLDPSKKKNKIKKHVSAEDDLGTQTFSIMNQLITDVKNRPVRTIKPSTTQTDMNSSWITEIANEKPSTSLVTRREKLEYKAGKVHPKDFRNQMLYNSSRVKRVSTKTLLKKRGAYV